jgi:hypothetical protein
VLRALIVAAPHVAFQLANVEFRLSGLRADNVEEYLDVGDCGEDFVFVIHALERCAFPSASRASI